MGLPDNSATPIRFTQSKDTSYRSSETGRPSGSVGSKKDFKKVLDKTDEDDSDNGQASKVTDEEGEAALNEAVAEIGKKKGPPSLFDLSSSKHVPSGFGKQGREMEEGNDSPSTVFAKISSPEPKKMVKGPVDDSEEGGALLDVPDKKQFTTRFATEQTDLSYVNPMAPVHTQVANVTPVKGEKPILPASHIQEIIDQMVSQVTEIKDTGRTETIVTLKHPPLFAGADIVVTAFDSAKGEFNISFENLSQAAKNILDQQSNRDSLLLALEQKGYNVHILTATTLAENRPVVEQSKPGEQPGQQNKDEQQGQQGRQGRQKGEDQS